MGGGRPGLYLLASYPKSGNTWVRIMLESWASGGETVDINRLAATSAIMSADLFQTLLDVEPGDLTLEEINRARPFLHRALAAETDEVRWFKCHDANLPAPGADEAPFPSQSLAGVVLLVRDPRDVAPSLAQHNGCPLDDAIAQMAEPRHVIGRSSSQLPQMISSWSLFQRSWLDTPGLRLLTLRYEDLARDPEGGLASVLAFAGLAADEDLIRRAVAATRFAALQRQEASTGFRERLATSSSAFFRRGLAGGWRNELTPAQAERILLDHGTVMAEFGYGA